MHRLIHRTLDGKEYLYSVELVNAWTGYWGYLADSAKKILKKDFNRTIVHWGVGEGTVPGVLMDYGFKNHYGVDPREWDEASTSIEKLTREQALALPIGALHIFDAYKGTEEQCKEEQELLKLWGHELIVHRIVGEARHEIHYYHGDAHAILWAWPSPHSAVRPR